MMQTLEKNLLNLMVEQSQKQTSGLQARELSQMIPMIQNSVLIDADVTLTLRSADGRQYMVIYNRDNELMVSQTGEGFCNRGRFQTSLRALIVDILARIKFSLKAAGTNYLIEGIMLLLHWKEDAHRLGMTKEIYPHIGQRYGVSPVSVERNMRLAIETAWSKMTYDYASEHYPFNYTSRLGRPTNQEFLFAVVRMVRYNYAEFLEQELAGLPKD